ncbi:18902_t:CDS:2, partial [Racocetra persica]
NTLLDLLVTADELNLIELVDYIQDYITSSLSVSNNSNNSLTPEPEEEEESNANNANNAMCEWDSMDWFRQNIVQVFNTVSCNGSLFGRLLSHCINLIISEPRLLFFSKDFGLLQEEALISIISNDNLQMKEIEVWESVIRWGLAQTDIKEPEPKNWSLEEIQELEKILRKSVQHVRFYQLTCTEYYYQVRKYKKLLPKELRENLKLYFIIPQSIPRTAILPSRIPKYTLESTIIDSKRTALIASWIDRKEDSIYYQAEENPYKFKLLLRGSRDGFLVEETGQIIMGGYNPRSWTGTNKFITSTESFIFSLCSESQSQITTLSRAVVPQFAISDDDSQFIGFGNGDLYIFKNSCQKRDYMYSILDRPKFSIDEIEVFQVVKKED